MRENYTYKKYESYKIQNWHQVQENGSNQSLSQAKSNAPISASNEMYYEIEYDSGPIPGVGKFVLKPKPQKLEESEKDAIRERFVQMREIARSYRSRYDFSRFFDRRVQNDNAMIFRQQGLFMKDFTDDFEGNAPFSQYFPCYQMMGYEQLRTYFTWRTQVRKGNITNTSLSYAFLYIYELLGNIGVTDPQDGLDRLMAFWKGFSVHNKSIEKYILRWLKDYHIYYELPQSWGKFVERNNLEEYYPKTTEPNSFELFCAISKYDIRKSAFYTGETKQMITECFLYVLERIRRDFEAVGIDFDDALFRPTKKLVKWKPFRDALFYNWLKQPDRRVVLSENEIYICKNNEWTFSTIITTEKGRRFIGYILKQMEAVLRKVTKYKYKLTANTSMINEETLRVLTKAGLFIEKIVTSAVMEFYREATKTIVTVDHAALARIRQEALATQEALIVEEQTQQIVEEQTQQGEFVPDPVLFAVQHQNVFADTVEPETTPVSDVWGDLKDALNENEIKALIIILHGEDIKVFADECGIMIEVLIDGINEKAMDYIGDNLVDEEFAIYNEYIDKVKELVK